MKNLGRTLRMIGVLAGLIMLDSTAQAQSRVFVSGVGDDLNPCTRTAPCRNFQRGHDAVAAKGEVVALDDGGFGAVTINKSVTISGRPGSHAGITATAGNAITISGLASTDVVILEGLHINGMGTGAKGISTSSGNIIVRDCRITNFTTGIHLVGTALSSARMDLIESDLSGNGTGVLSEGAGANFPGNPGAVSQAMVRINGGNITNNGIGLHQKAPGTGPSMTNLSNIALFSPGSGGGVLTNIVGNSTNLVCSVTAGCTTFPITYQFNSSFGP